MADDGKRLPYVPPALTFVANVEEATLGPIEQPGTDTGSFGLPS